MKTLIAASLLFLASFAHADATDDVLVKIDQYLAVPSFEESYKPGDVTEIRMDETFSGGKSESTVFQEVTARTSDVADLVFKAPDGRVSSTQKVKYADWSAVRGNTARSIINDLRGWGFKVDLEIVDFTEVRLMVNSRPARFGAIKMAYVGTNGVGSKITGELTVTNALPARAQVVVRRENPMSGLTRVWSIISFNRKDE